MEYFSKQELVGLYSTMMRIRMVEERIAELYPLGEMRTPIHFSIGQEAVSAGVCAALKSSDSIFCSHRSHAAYFAKGGSLEQMLAELYGRSSGACKGKSGSAHLACPEKNMYSAPILGAMISVAVGSALASSLDKNKRVSVAFFGDAAIEEGVCPESVNFAVIKKLPVIFVCENNFFSTHTHIRYRQPNMPIYKRVRSFGVVSKLVDGNDVFKVHSAARKAVNYCRKGRGPFFLECVTYRYREHVGPNFDFNNPYRTKEEVQYWMQRCPIKKIEKFLLAKRIINEKEIDFLKSKINSEINKAVEYARKSPWPHKGGLVQDVY